LVASEMPPLSGTARWNNCGFASTVAGVVSSA
jgi:hypothetical protein